MAKAIVVGVSDYSKINGCDDLPFCKNDLYAIQESLVNGLNFNKNDILLLGEFNTVTNSDINTAFSSIVNEEDETLIFYFSGHGGKGLVCLSDCFLEIKDLINSIEKLKFKNKIIILDCCQAGNFTISQTPQIDITQMVSSFAGHGYAVLASCSSQEKSGFHPTKKISLYTSFICDALQFRSIIKKGKKSLEDIKDVVYTLAKQWNIESNKKIQTPIFRKNIGGTVFFDVEEYNPYQKHSVFEETDEYIIYEVEPVHTANTKRYSVKIILRNMYDLEKIAELSKEIVNKAKFYEVYSNESSEISMSGKIANIIWCYFGYDESDLINGRFALITTWIDDTQDKKKFYKLTSNTFMLNDVFFKKIDCYSILKNSTETQISKEELIRLTNELTFELLNVAEKYIGMFYEYQNKEIIEDQFIEKVFPLNNEINKLFLKQSDLPVAPDDLHDWSQANIDIASSIYDFSLFYNKKYLNKSKSENREWLIKDSIKRYENALEKLKKIQI